MRLHELFREISNILTPNTGKLYDYMLHTFDWPGGFLRTRWCYWDKETLDADWGDISHVLLCCKRRFTEGDEFYEEDRDWPGNKLTLVKMQLFGISAGADDETRAVMLEDNMKWSCALGYDEACVINLQTKTFYWQTVEEYV